MVPGLATPQFSPTVCYLTVTPDSFLMDPPRGHVRLMEHGVDLGPFVLVRSEAIIVKKTLQLVICYPSVDL